MPHDAFRDPYALLTQANDTNDADWFRKQAEPGQWKDKPEDLFLEIMIIWRIECSGKTLFFYPLCLQTEFKH